MTVLFLRAADVLLSFLVVNALYEKISFLVICMAEHDASVLILQ